MDVEQIVMKSTVDIKVDIADRLVQVPLDDRPDTVAWLGRLLKVVFYEEKVAGAWLTTALVGYCGRDEFIDRPRELWVRHFPEPLPPCHRLELRRYGEMVTFVLENKQYLFSTFDGSYLEHTRAGTA